MQKNSNAPDTLKEKIILTGDRPTGCLHLGHYVGSLKNRLAIQDKVLNKLDKINHVKMQNTSLDSNYNTNKSLYNNYILIADTQSLTDNFADNSTLQQNIIEVLKDYIAIGIDPSVWCIMLQSKITELFELTSYLMNLSTLNNLERIPTLKVEMQQKNFDRSIPIGFLTYPISQAADILMFHANLVPAGEDQKCLIEFSNTLLEKYNQLYCKNFKRFEHIDILLSNTSRLIGIDGKQKASKSLNNAILLKDDPKTLKAKINLMYTDPNHIKITDPGQVEGNVVFTYLDAFYSDKSHLEEIKKHYKKGGLGDGEVKNILFDILNSLLLPIRDKREKLHNDDMLHIINNGTKYAKSIAAKNIEQIRKDLNLLI